MNIDAEALLYPDDAQDAVYKAMDEVSLLNIPAAVEAGRAALKQWIVEHPDYVPGPQPIESV